MDQSTRDALADAETLRLMARSLHTRGGWKRTRLARAARDGEFVGQLLDLSARFGIDGASAPWYAKSAARAAFGAVPGLRVS